MTIKRNEQTTQYEVSHDNKVIASFLESEDAYLFTSAKSEPSEFGKRAARASYYSDVSEMAESIKDELRDQIKDGEEGKSLREWLLEHIHESIDSSARIIYTAKAMECVMYSDNDGAYFEEFGDEGAVENGSINWSRIAFSAFERDVIEALASDDIDVNDLDDFVDAVKEDLANEKRSRVMEAVGKLDRERIVNLLAQASIDSDDDEDLATLREAVIENVMDDTIKEDDLQ